MAGLSSFLALVLAIALWAVLRDDRYVAPAPHAPSDRIQPDAAAAALQSLGAAIRAGDPDAAAALAGSHPTAARRLRTLVGNATAVPVRQVSLRYLGPVGGVDEAGEWTADADLAWRYADADRRPSRSEVRVRFAAEGDAVSILSVGEAGGRVPVWVSGPVMVRRSADTLVVARHRAAYYERLARRAVRVVHRVLPGWRERLVVEVPASGRALDRALAAEPGEFAGIAGVTTEPDGRSRTGAPVHVFLNPERLATLRPQGAQVVVSHEAAHVALGATGSDLPVWLLEGFADYVALRNVRLPLSTTASQIIRQVRREGPPGHLPDEGDFDEESAHFGAAYEAAWLACRLLADRVGERRLVRFYRRADGAPDFQRLFRSTFGIGEKPFTRQWQQALSDLAA